MEKVKSKEEESLRVLNTKKEEFERIVKGVLPYTQVSVKEAFRAKGKTESNEKTRFVNRFVFDVYPRGVNCKRFTEPFEFLFSDQVVLSEDDFIKFHIQLVFTELQLLWVEFLRKYVTDYNGLENEFLSTLIDILRAVQFNGSVISTALQKAMFYEQWDEQRELKKSPLLTEEYILQVNVERLKREAKSIKIIDGLKYYKIFDLDQEGIEQDHTNQFFIHLYQSVNENREEIRKILRIDSDT